MEKVYEKEYVYVAGPDGFYFTGGHMRTALSEQVQATGMNVTLPNRKRSEERAKERDEVPVDTSNMTPHEKRRAGGARIFKGCADSMADASKIATLNPDIIVAEPSELIGTGVSVGPEYVEAATKCVKDVNSDILVLTAAGIANGQDVYNTIIAGADATGSSSGIAKAADRAAMVDEMIAAVRKAWDERNA